MLGLARILLLFACLASVNGAPKQHKRHFHQHHENSKRHLHQHKDSKLVNDPLTGPSCDTFVTLDHGWSQGQQAKMEFTVPQAVNGWKITVEFSRSPIRNFQLQNTRQAGNYRKCRFTFTNYQWNSKINADQKITYNFMYGFSGNPKPKIAYVKFESGSFSMTCGAPACPAPTQPPTLAPGVTTPIKTTTPRPTLPPLQGACSNFIRIKQSNPGSEFGVIRFSLPTSIATWTLKVGFSETVQNFQVQRGANMLEVERPCTEVTLYNYVKAGNRPDNADKPMRFPYVLHYNQNAAKPIITYFEISDGSNTYMCGTQPSCPTTTTTTITTTTGPSTTEGEPTTAGSTTPITETTVTPEAPPQPLSGDDCAAFLKNVENGFSDEQGTIEFLVPQQSNEWVFNVGFTPAMLPNTFDVFDRAVKQQSADRCFYEFTNAAEDTYEANSLFSKQYRSGFDAAVGESQIEYISFSSGDFQMECGSNDCPVLTTPTAGPTTIAPNTTTTPLVTSPPLAGATCEPYVEFTQENLGQTFGNIRITTTEDLTEFQIIVGFSSSTTGFNIKSGVNRFTSSETCPGFNYVFQSIPNGEILAGTTFVFPFSLSFDQNSADKPVIEYIKFANDSCGTEPVCPTTTTAKEGIQ